MAEYTKEPRITVSKENCKCAETGEPIYKGEKILYVPEEKACYTIYSEKAMQFFEDERKKAEQTP